jgi:hypothetical protein
MLRRQLVADPHYRLGHGGLDPEGDGRDSRQQDKLLHR